MSKFGECFVDCFARCANKLRDFFLGEVVVNAPVSVVVDAEAIGQLEKGFGHATGDVSEDKVGQRIVGAAEAACENAEKLFRDRRVVADPLVELFRVHRCGGYFCHTNR